MGFICLKCTRELHIEKSFVDITYNEIVDLDPTIRNLLEIQQSCEHVSASGFQTHTYRCPIWVSVLYQGITRGNRQKFKLLEKLCVENEEIASIANSFLYFRYDWCVGEMLVINILDDLVEYLRQEKLV